MKPVRKLSLDQWLSWMEACHPAEIELGLGRVGQVAENLGIDLSASTVVTIAGTNGKGSTVSYLDQIYRSAGYSVGCFTSPHFIAYNERVRLNGVNSSDEILCNAFERIDQARAEIPLTYFEFGTLAALLIFSDQKPDLVLLEVGLGGRLDAVNIVDPDIAVVTTVALDHIEWLGDNREMIGREKAGIFRPETPAVCGDLEPPASVAVYADEIGAPLYQSGEAFGYRIEVDNLWSWQGKNVEGEPIAMAFLPMPGLPLQNAATALQALQFIPFAVTDEQIRQGIKDAGLTGRMQKITQGSQNYWLDVAHNPEASELLAQRVNALAGDKLLILGMLADKDCAMVMDTLLPCFEKVILVDLNVPRGQTAEDLQQHIAQWDNLMTEKSVIAAIERVKTAYTDVENVIIAGSFFTVADALVTLDRDN